MSIQSEINRISGNVSDALDAIEDKGVAIPSGANSDDLADLIAQITGGGGVGGITQDEDGYLVLSPDAPSPTPGGGLEYETGTWTPTADTADAWISFVNTHTTAPTMYEISDATGTYDSTTNTNVQVHYVHWEQLFGEGQFPSGSQINYGRVDYTYRATNTSNFSSSATGVYYPISDTGDSSKSRPRYWAKETGIRAYADSTTRYWRSGRTYKWIAVWAPTT